MNNFLDNFEIENRWLWQLGGVVFTVALGTILHFLYVWTGRNIGVATFSAVNESTWEHMKLLFVPMLVFAVIQSFFYGKEYAGFWWVKLIGIAVGVTLIPVLFYTLNGMFGKTPDWVNIGIFFLSTIVGYALELKLLQSSLSQGRFSWVAIVILLLIAVAFVLFTFVPPDLPLFVDPLAK